MTRGRPRSAEAHASILQAALALLVEEGYRGFPMEAVAGTFFVLISVMFIGLGQHMGRAFDAIPDRVWAYSFDRAIKNHLSYATLTQHRARLGCHRLVLTHLGPDMLDRLNQLEEATAFDGLSFTI